MNAPIRIWLEGGVIHNIENIPESAVIEVCNFDIEDIDPDDYEIRTNDGGQEYTVVRWLPEN